MWRALTGSCRLGALVDQINSRVKCKKVGGCNFASWWEPAAGPTGKNNPRTQSPESVTNACVRASRWLVALRSTAQVYCTRTHAHMPVDASHTLDWTGSKWTQLDLELGT